MSRSIKSAVLAALIVLILSASPSYAAGRQNREQDRQGNPIQRVVQIVKRLFGVTAHDEIIIPHP